MKIAFLGDIALFGRASFSQNPQGADYFQEAAQHLADYDYVVGNLESPFSAKKKKWGAKSAFLCSDPENVEVLKMLHVKAVTLANNHMFDYGSEAFELTRKLLDEAGIAWFGVNGKEHLLELDGNKVAFTGFCCYSTNPQGCVAYGKYGINELDVCEAENVLARLHQEGCLNVCAVHAGIEHVNYPSLDTIAVAKRLAAIAPTFYYGHHPHVAQPVEAMDESLVAYSLGNFCFDDTDAKPMVELSEDNRSSFILSVTIENNHIKDYDIVPIYIGKDKLHVGQGVDSKQLDCYLAKMMSLTPTEYEAMRHEQRMLWVKPRLAKRNLSWVLKRLRPRYVLLAFTNKRNARNYVEKVKKQIAQ